MRTLLPVLLGLVFVLTACGGAAPQPTPPAPTGPAPVADGPLTLAVAVEGDVKALGEVEYEVNGPEVRLLAKLMQGGQEVAGAGSYTWSVSPGGAGDISMGAQGVYFMPKQKGRAEIVATYIEQGAPRATSPKLTLISP